MSGGTTMHPGTVLYRSKTLRPTIKNVPVERELNRGKVLYRSATLKPDLSALPQYNAVGGRADERRGTTGGFAKGPTVWGGGLPRDVPLEREVNHGKVLYRSEVLKPDLSVLPKTNVIGKRPLERLGSYGSYTPGVKTLQGGKARDVPLEREVNHGTVLYVSDTLKPDVSGLPQTNIVGGRPDERRGSKGSFTEGLRSWAGGLPRDVPLECELEHGTVLYSSERLKPDMSFEGETNDIGGRPEERHGREGSFSAGWGSAEGGTLRYPATNFYPCWTEDGQKEHKNRRFTTSHFLVGVTVLAGGCPSY